MSPLDPATLSSLQELDPGGTRGLFHRLIEAFDRTWVRQDHELTEALAQGPDLVRVARVAHTLRSASSHLGALSAAEQCKALEQLCQAGDSQRAVDACHHLRLLLADAQRALHALRGNAR
jgi:HPt (histidine-containing phosphotransfer) domain-containing protein